MFVKGKCVFCVAIEGIVLRNGLLEERFAEALPSKDQPHFA